LRRIFAKLAKERKETKEALWKFRREIVEKVIPRLKVQNQKWWKNLTKGKKQRGKFAEKPPPLHSDAWLLGVVPALRRAPNGAALWRCVGGSRFHAA
jgi:hypothetical protein